MAPDPHQQFTLWVSGTALFLSVANSLWAIYKEYGLKARVKVSVAVIEIVGDPPPGTKQTSIRVTAVNFGPGEIMLTSLDLQNTRKTRRNGSTKFGALIADWRSTLNTPFPAKLARGEQACFIVPYEKNCFLATRHARIGVLDTFDRQHWAPRKALRRAEEQWKKNYAEAKEP
jgi:hypothetical protein